MPRQEYMAREILALQAAEGSRNILCTDVCAQSIITGIEIDFQLSLCIDAALLARSSSLLGSRFVCRHHGRQQANRLPRRTRRIGWNA